MSAWLGNAAGAAAALAEQGNPSPGVHDEGGRLSQKGLGEKRDGASSEPDAHVSVAKPAPLPVPSSRAAASLPADEPSSAAGGAAVPCVALRADAFGNTVVFGVEPDSPLAAQLEAGDVVVSVDGRAALARGPAEVQDMLSGVRGTLVAVGVTRPGAGGAPRAPGAAARVVQLLRDIPLAQLGADTPRRAGTGDGGDRLHDRVPEMGLTTRGLHDTLHDTRHTAAAVGVPAGGRAAQGDAAARAEAGRSGTPLQRAPRAAPLAASRPARTGGASGAPRQPGATRRADAAPAKGVGPRGEATARAPADAPARRAGSAAPATAAVRGRAAGGDGSGCSSGGGAAAWALPESGAERGPRGH
jgi:hypothetical protein